MGNVRCRRSYAALKPLSVRTEVNNDSQGRSKRAHRLHDPRSLRQARWQRTPLHLPSISPQGEQTYEQKISVERPLLWSLEERNLYKLVTEVQADGQVSIATRRRSAFARSSSIRSKAVSERQAREAEGNLQSPGSCRGWARRCPTPCSTTAFASCRRWAATHCALRTIRQRRNCWTPVTSWACWSSMRRA